MARWLPRGDVDEHEQALKEVLDGGLIVSRGGRVDVPAAVGAKAHYLLGDSAACAHLIEQPGLTSRQ